MLFIEVDDKRDEVLAALGERGLAVQPMGAGIIAENLTDEQFDDVRDAIVETGARLRRLAPRRRQLADIFRGDQP